MPTRRAAFPILGTLLIYAQAPELVFTGNIVALAPEKITVQRTGTSEKRTFFLDSRTRVEGKLAVRARVTVGYTSSEGGDRALRIIVRADKPPDVEP